MVTLSRFQVTLLRAVLVVVMLPASCIGPPYLYYFSPKLLMDKVNLEKDFLFFVAFYARENGGDKKLFVFPIGYEPKKFHLSDVQYHLDKPKLSYKFGGRDGEGGAEVKLVEDNEEGQLVQIFSTGDTSWTSLSEYRVVGNKVIPLRFARSNIWILVAWPFLFACFYLINRKLAILEEKKYEGPDPPSFTQSG